MSNILQSNSGSTSSEADDISNSKGSDPTMMTSTVDLLLASQKQKQASILVMNG